jgi:hypothetical protein
MRRIVLVAAAALTAWAFAGPAGAQSFGFSGFGGKLGYTHPEGLEGTLHAGAHLEFEAAGTRLHILPNLMYWRSEDVSNVNPNLDLYYHFSRNGLMSPYLGAGVGVHFMNDDRFEVSDTNVGANVFGGVRIPGSFNYYFLEGRYSASDVSQFSVLGGLTFRH